MSTKNHSGVNRRSFLKTTMLGSAAAFITGITPGVTYASVASRPGKTPRKSDIRIKEIKITPVATFDVPLRVSWGVHPKFARRTIVQLITNKGITGLGEMHGKPETINELKQAGEVVAGEDPWNLEKLRAQISSNWVYSTIEMACLDIIGKATEQPVCDVLGGRARNEVAFAAYLYYKFKRDDPRDEWGEVLTPKALVNEAKTFVKRFGFKTLKLKGGVLHPDKEVKTMELLRQEFPEYALRIDPNGVWTVETSISTGKKLQPLKLEYYEDPTLDKEDMAAVRKAVDIPMATNACVKGWDDIAQAYSMGSIDVLLSDLHYWGGLRAGKQVGKTAAALNWGVSMHSNSHLGISMAAMLHLAATTPELTYDADTHYPWRIEDVITTPFTFNNGKLKVPDKPGLGVELDEKKLAEMHAYYKKMQDYNWDFKTEMKKYDPSWELKWPRW